jgi:hypothetical protein
MSATRVTGTVVATSSVAEQAARALSRAFNRLREARTFGLPADERASRVHVRSLGPGQPATGAGSGRTITVSAIGTISSTGRSAAWAWRLIASGLSAS